jgi:hypothetical protein
MSHQYEVQKALDASEFEGRRDEPTRGVELLVEAIALSSSGARGRQVVTLSVRQRRS